MSNHLLNRKTKASYQRYRTLARSLGARIFATAEGRLFLVGGMPEFDRLRLAFSRLREITSPVQAPNPTDLGLQQRDSGVVRALAGNFHVSRRISPGEMRSGELRGVAWLKRHYWRLRGHWAVERRLRAEGR